MALGRLLGLATALALAACGSRTSLLAGEAQQATPSPDGGAGEETSSLSPIYLIDQGTESPELSLSAFDPSKRALIAIGPMDCPDATGSPSLFAVNHLGAAFVVFIESASLYRLSTATARCDRVGDVGTPGWGFLSSSVAFSGDPADEALYGLTVEARSGATWLVNVSADTFSQTTLARLAPNTAIGMLTGTGDGGLFALDTGAGSSLRLARIDRATGQVTPEALVPIGDPGATFATWGGDFYFFPRATSVSGTNESSVLRFRPSDGSMMEVGRVNGVVLVATVQTSAPSR